tara:strand:+ start:747 stop:1430 length:684 start_codon:yes stop_codon:yes gene_type:complete
MKIAFIIPSTSNGRDWSDFSETYLNRITGKTIPKTYNIKLFVGYNDDDVLYSKPEQRVDNIDNILIEWISFNSDYKGNPCGIWNTLGHIAVGQNYDYLMVLGDDISMPENEIWLNVFLEKLIRNNNIGFSAGWSNNDSIPTQFLIHKKHLEIFGWIYPPLIKNWYIDNWMSDLYGNKYGNWLKEYHLLNVGGEPRYTPNDDKNLCKILVKKHRKILYKYLNKNKYLD